MSLAETKSADFVISRVLDAPREMVWKCFTDPEHLKQWWGPKGITVPVATMDLRPGGVFHYRMDGPGGPSLWGKMAYREITPRDRIVFINSFSDEHGGTIHADMAPDWPMEMLTIITFEDEPDGKTRFTVRSSPYNATAAEAEVFHANHDSMRHGWGGSFDKLAAYLPKAK